MCCVNKRLSLKKKIVNCSSYFTALQDISNLETQSSNKTTANFKNIKILKIRSSGFQIICLFV